MKTQCIYLLMVYYLPVQAHTVIKRDYLTDGVLWDDLTSLIKQMPLYFGQRFKESFYLFENDPAPDANSDKEAKEIQDRAQEIEDSSREFVNFASKTFEDSLKTEEVSKTVNLVIDGVQTGLNKFRMNTVPTTLSTTEWP